MPRRFRWVFPFLLLCSGCDGAQVGAASFEKLQSELEETKKERSDLEKKIAEATDLEAWILAAVPLQPLIVEIIRSMEPGSKIEHLQLERDAETPSQVRIRLVLNTESDKQLEQTLEAIHKMNFRESSQTYTQSNGELVYTARLLRQDPRSQCRQAPLQSQNSSVTVPLASRNKAEGADAGGEQARADEKELQIQLGIERELLANLQQQSADLLNFVSTWEPYFALVEDQQLAQAAISIKVREADMRTLSQSYEQVPYKIADKDVASLPTLTRATLVFDDRYGKLLNWLGTMEKIRPTMRVGKLDMTKGSSGEDLRMELTLEVPLRRRES